MDGTAGGKFTGFGFDLCAVKHAANVGGACVVVNLGKTVIRGAVPLAIGPVRVERDMNPDRKIFTIFVANHNSRAIV